MRILTIILQYMDYWLSIFLLLSFVLLLFLNKAKIRRQLICKDQGIKPLIPKKWVTILILLLILIIGLILRLVYVPHTHYVYNDELFHIDIAKNILAEQRVCIRLSDLYHNDNLNLLPQWMPLFHFFLSITFFFTGASSSAVFMFNTIISVLTILVFFGIGRLYFRNNRAGLILAGLLCLSPLHMKFSGGGHLEQLSLLCIALLFFFAFLYKQEPDVRSGLLLLVASLMAVMVRIENAILAVFTCFLIGSRIVKQIFYKKHDTHIEKNKAHLWLIAGLLVTFFITIIQFIISFEIYSYWRESVKVIPFLSFFKFQLFNILNPIILTPLALCGIYFLWKKDKQLAILLPICWILFVISYSIVHKLDLNYRDFHRYNINLLFFQLFLAVLIIESFFNTRKTWMYLINGFLLVIVLMYPIIAHHSIQKHYWPDFKAEEEWIRKEIVNINPLAIICSEEAVFIRSVTGRKTTIPHPIRDQGIRDSEELVFYLLPYAKRKSHTDWISQFKDLFVFEPLIIGQLNGEETDKNNHFGFYSMTLKQKNE